MKSFDGQIANWLTKWYTGNILRFLSEILKTKISRCDGQYAARCTLNSCLVGVVIALPQKRSGEWNGALVDNTEGLSCFGISDYLGNYCPSLPWIWMKQVLDNQSASLNSKMWKLHAQLDDDDWMIAAEKFKKWAQIWSTQDWKVTS